MYTLLFLTILNHALLWFVFQVTPVKKIRPRPVPKPAPVEKNIAWDIPAIQCYEPDDGVFYAQMGPTGGKHGYSAITGEYILLV